MFEILMFLFENYMDGSVTFKIDNSDIAIELERVGFDPYAIDRALQWLDGLVQVQAAISEGSKLSPLAIRHYSVVESERLGTTGIGFLFYLEKINVLDPATREIVIDRIMALDAREVDIPRIRWVVLMVLFNHPEKKSAMTLMQDMILADAFDVLH